MIYRRRHLIGCAVLAAIPLAVSSCSLPGRHSQGVPPRGPEPITASELKAFEDMLADVAAGVGVVGGSSGGGASRRVCMIEERHTSAAGQLEAAVMLLRLHDRYGLRHIALEGLTTDKPSPSPQWYGRLGGPDDEDVRREILVGLLREGEISAAELMTLAFPDVVIHAADDPADYAVELTARAVGAPTNYLYKISLKSVGPRHDPHIWQFNRQHKVAELVDYVISLDGWARVRHESLSSGGDAAPAERVLRELEEIKARAGLVGAEITPEERAAMSEARAFFEATARRSSVMAQAVQSLDSSARVVALNIRAAHTEGVARALKEAGTTYAVLSPAALREDGGRGDVSRESSERKGRASAVAGTDKSLGSLLDGRKKPPPSVDKTWLKAAAQLRFATVLIARAQLGTGFPGPELRGKVDSLDHVRLEWGSVREVAGNKLFMASVLGESGWTDIWGYCGRPRAEIIRLGRRSLEEVLVENLNAVRREGGRRAQPPKIPVFELVTQDVIAAYVRDHSALREVMRAG